MKIIKNNQLTDGHLHAWCLYEPVSWRHFFYLFFSASIAGLFRVKSLTTHLPLELQHGIYKNKKTAFQLLKFGDFLRTIFRIKLYWENAPLLNDGSWDLKHGQTEWHLVPSDIELCLDTGHLILGSASSQEAKDRILRISRERHSQIRHLHIHENNFIRDEHKKPEAIITPDILKEITENKTYIFEK